MSTIDTGLGWSCDSSFYVDDTTTALGVNRLGETYRKVNAGAAICGKFKSEGGYDSLYTVSTVADNVVMNPSYANTRFSIVDGTVWYLGIPEYGCEKNTDYSDFPWVNENDPYPAISTWTQAVVDDIIAMFLTAANVQSTADKIPTTDYVKSYVEGVEAETATRVNANKASIGTLSNLTTTEKSSLVGAINELESTKQSKTTSEISTARCKPYANFFEPVTWNGLTSFNGNYIWSDGENIYYSNGGSQYVLNKSTSTWSTKTWNGLTSFYGNMVWTDGENIYYSYFDNQYVLNKSTSTWSTKTWNGLTSFNGNYIWSDGENIYYSNGGSQYVLNKSTSTWSTKTWNGLTNFDGNMVWANGVNIYYGDTRVLNRSTSTWESKTWNGLTNFDSRLIWSDGENIYYSNLDSQYVLNGSTWEANKAFPSNINMWGEYVWTDGENIYYSSGTNQYVLKNYNISVRK